MRLLVRSVDGLGDGYHGDAFFHLISKMDEKLADIAVIRGREQRAPERHDGSRDSHLLQEVRPLDNP